MCTVGKLRELLLEYPKDHIIVDYEAGEFIHINMAQGDKVILSTKKPIGSCPKCGDYVYPSREIKKYKGVCPTCDENFFEFEIEPLPIKEEEEEEEEN